MTPHDFPVPGYLLNVSEHMFLENHPIDTRDHSNDSASNHDETLANGFQNRNLKHSFENMKIEKKEGNVFDIIKRQVEIHHNTSMTMQQCTDSMETVMKEFIPIDIPPKVFSATLINNLTKENITTALKVASKLFNCKIVVFFKNEADYAIDEIKTVETVLEAPLHFMFDGKTGT